MEKAQLALSPLYFSSMGQVKKLHCFHSPAEAVTKTPTIYTITSPVTKVFAKTYSLSHLVCMISVVKFTSYFASATTRDWLSHYILLTDSQVERREYFFVVFQFARYFRWVRLKDKDELELGSSHVTTTLKYIG